MNIEGGHQNIYVQNTLNDRLLGQYDSYLAHILIHFEKINILQLIMFLYTFKLLCPWNIGKYTTNKTLIAYFE